MSATRTDLISRIACFDEPVRLRGYGALHLGGTVRTVDGVATPDIPDSWAVDRPWDQRGHYAVGQLYVQAFLVAAPRHPSPICLWHGGGMTGAMWEATPDGRPGWLNLFLQAGWDVLVSDGAERGRAGIPHPDLVDGPPVFRPHEVAWEGFRFGPAGSWNPEGGHAFAGQQFPVEAFAAFCRQFVARWPGFAPAIVAAYQQLLADIDRPAVLVAHSEGAIYALEVALAAPERVAAMVLIEPAGAPATATDVGPRRLAGLPILSVWGDFIAASPRWQTLRARYRAFAETLELAGAAHHCLDLPAIGITGNSHFPMSDRNADVVWRRVNAWLWDVCATRQDGPAPEDRQDTPPHQHEQSGRTP